MYIYATDIHLSDRNPINRLDNALDSTFAKLEEIFQLAKLRKCSIIMGGDLFDGPDPSYSILNRLIDLIVKYDVDIYSVLGNHDLEGNNTDFHNAAIFTLLKSQKVHLLNELSTDSIVIRGVSYNNIKEFQEKDYIFGPQYTNHFKVIVTHNSICPTPVIFDHKLVASINTDANLVLCGHIHDPFEVKHLNTWFMNPGCLVRRRVNEKNIVPKVYIFDQNGIEHYAISSYKSAEEAFRSREVKEGNLDDFTKAIKDVKIESKDIESLIYNQLDASAEAKEECIKRIKRAKERVC